MSNCKKGRDMVLAVSTDGGTTYNPAAGIRTKSLSRENPVTDTTNQADVGNETGSCYTGYSTVTMSGEGVYDSRVTDLYAYGDLADAANSANPVIDAELTGPQGETYTGMFTITTFEITAEQNGVVEFSISLQNEGTVTYVSGTL